jgi:hypothetical protein
MIDYYLGVKMAVLELAYDNGMINRDEPLEKFLDFVEGKIANINKGLLGIWSTYLVQLSEDDFQNFVCGDDSIEHENVPQGLHEFLNDIFESY